MPVELHEHIACSAKQSKTWYELVVDEFEDVVQDENFVKGREIWNHRPKIFK